MQHARSGSVWQRFLRNEFCRQIVMEVGDEHGEIIGFEVTFPDSLQRPAPGTFYLHILTLDWL
jgi:hypothetical protein